MDLRENKGAEMATVSITKILRSFAKIKDQEIFYCRSLYEETLGVSEEYCEQRAMASQRK